jgi:hypothetical protein
MNSIAPAVAASAKPYRELLREVRRLRQSGRKNLYRRVKLLVAIFNDPDFRAEHGNCDDCKAADFLNAEIDDIGIDFLDLKRVFERFPKAKSWREFPIRRLLEETNRKEESSAPSEPRKPRRLTEEQRDHYEAQLVEGRKIQAGLRSQLISISDQFQAAQDERTNLLKRIAELEAENIGLKARVIELEARLK